VARITRRIVSSSDSAQACIDLIGMGGLLLRPVRHRLFWRLCNALAPLGGGRSCVLEVDENSVMKVLLDDPYRSRMVASSFDYEPDFKSVIARLTSLDFVFLDCGANFGYWSILLSSEKYGGHDTVAIEAAHDTLEILLENCALNRNRFRCLHRALSSETGRSVVMDSTAGHAGARLAELGAASTGSRTVDTVTLDDAAIEAFGAIPSRILVKLDVEGQEINALAGARRLLEADVAFYYEDHGRDESSAVTAFVLDTLGLNVHFANTTGGLQAISSPREASRVKVRKSYGYNFIATKPDSAFLDFVSR